MKKVLGILIVMGLLLGITSVAMATETDWTVFIRASSATYTNAAAYTKIGTVTGKFDTKDTTDSKYVANTGAQAQVVSYQPTWPDSPAFYAVDQRAPITAGETKVWDLLVWAGNSYTQNAIRLGLWGSTNAVPATIGGKDYTYTLKVVSDPTGTYTAGKEFSWTPGAVGSSTAPALFADFGVVKTADAGAPDAGIKLQFIAAPVSIPDTPEPGSMLALGSGLVGLMGFAIRRRRA